MRYGLTDFEWSNIQSLLPDKSHGVPRVDNRRVLNGTPLTAPVLPFERKTNDLKRRKFLERS